MQGDLAGYIRDYVETVTSLWAPRGVKIEVSSDEKPLERAFRPIEVGIVIDNLVCECCKGACFQSWEFSCKSPRVPIRNLIITVADDGAGWSESLDSLE